LPAIRTIVNRRSLVCMCSGMQVDMYTRTHIRAYLYRLVHNLLCVCVRCMLKVCMCAGPACGAARRRLTLGIWHGVAIHSLVAVDRPGRRHGAEYPSSGLPSERAKPGQGLVSQNASPVEPLPRRRDQTRPDYHTPPHVNRRVYISGNKPPIKRGFRCVNNEL
jgi:hypothetical protein